MLLYDIFYADGSMDRDRPLPNKSERGTIARNTNWDHEVLIFNGTDWVTHTYEDDDE